MRNKGSNWETIAFLLIRNILTESYYFSRADLMKPDNIMLAIDILKQVGHKEHPEHPEETLQKTIQNLRDKGYIDFLGRGEYKLKENGLTKMNEIYDAFILAMNNQSR